VTVQSGKLKSSGGWFAAGREVSRALALLSDGAFRLFIYFCLNADRKTGQIRITHGALAKAVGRSRRSIIIYMEELQRQQVCRVQRAANQHVSGHIEICDSFWPYEKAQKQETLKDRTSYVAQIRQLMGSRRCIANSFPPADENLANALFRRGIPIQQVGRGFLLGCARKYSTLLNNKSNELIVSFSYFQNVIDEAGELQMSTDYWRYLQLRIDKMEQQWLKQHQEADGTRFNNRRSAPMSGRI
jgi:hypothetical protein